MALVGYFHNETRSWGVILAMVEKELGERNFGFDSLKSRLKRDMEEKGIAARDCLLPGHRRRSTAAEEPRRSQSRATIPAFHWRPRVAIVYAPGQWYRFTFILSPNDWTIQPINQYLPQQHSRNTTTCREEINR